MNGHDHYTLEPTAEKRKPLIGLSPRVQPPEYYKETNEFDAGGHQYVIKQSEIRAIENSGGRVAPLFHDVKKIPEYVKTLDGLVLSGSSPDIADPSKLTKLIQERLIFEAKLTREMIRAGKPVFAMCGGMQLITMMMGGTLLENIDTGTDHHPNYKYHEVAHPIQILDPDSVMGKAAGGGSVIGVNSLHHQGIMKDQMPKSVKVTAVAPDGIVETCQIDAGDTPIASCTQWHPELTRLTSTTLKPESRNITEQDLVSKNLYDMFVKLALELKVKPLAPELTASIVQRIDDVDLVGQVRKMGYIPDYVTPAVMPVATIHDASKMPQASPINTHEQQHIVRQSPISPKHVGRSSISPAGVLQSKINGGQIMSNL